MHHIKYSLYHAKEIAKKVNNNIMNFDITQNEYYIYEFKNY